MTTRTKDAFYGRPTKGAFFVDGQRSMNQVAKLLLLWLMVSLVACEADLAAVERFRQRATTGHQTSH